MTFGDFIKSFFCILKLTLKHSAVKDWCYVSSHQTASKCNINRKEIFWAKSSNIFDNLPWVFGAESKEPTKRAKSSSLSCAQSGKCNGNIVIHMHIFTNKKLNSCVLMNMSVVIIFADDSPLEARWDFKIKGKGIFGLRSFWFPFGFCDVINVRAIKKTILDCRNTTWKPN